LREDAPSSKQLQWKWDLERSMVVKTTKITIETQSFTIIRHTSTISAWCPGCSAEVDMIQVDEGGGLDSIPAPLMQSWLATGALHVRPLVDGQNLVCLPSLLNCFGSQGGRVIEASYEIQRSEEKGK
jgi:hypothetical protein